MLNSRYCTIGEVALPPFAHRVHYMHAFDMANPVMRAGFENYLPCVRSMLQSVGALRGTAYMTVDERVVAAGSTQRKPRPHVDGCFMPDRDCWAHGCARMPIIVAASVAGCRVWRGRLDTIPRDDGDVSHAESLLGEGEIIPAHVGALLSPDCVHESLPLRETTARTFLRIALPTSFRGDWA